MIGNGVVQSIIYKINGRRVRTVPPAQSVDKISANPLLSQPQNWGTEVNDVLSDPIFTYFQSGRNSIPIHRAHRYQQRSCDPCVDQNHQISRKFVTTPSIDRKTNQAIERLRREVSINNCSMATTGQATSCQ